VSFGLADHNVGGHNNRVAYYSGSYEWRDGQRHELR
jgi:hypothetical protein